MEGSSGHTEVQQFSNIGDASSSTAVVPDTTSNPSSGHTKNNLVPDGMCKWKNKYKSCNKKVEGGTSRCELHPFNPRSSNKKDNNNNNNNNSNNAEKRIKTTSNTQKDGKSKGKETQYSIDVMAKVADIENKIIELMELIGTTDGRIEVGKVTLTWEHKGSDIRSLLIKANLRTAIEDAASTEQSSKKHLKLDIETTLLA